MRAHSMRDRRVVIYYSGNALEETALGGDGRQGPRDKVEMRISSIDEAATVLSNANATEPSSLTFAPRVWYRQPTGADGGQDGGKGRPSFHPEGFTEEEERCLFERMVDLQMRQRVEQAEIEASLAEIHESYRVENGLIVSNGQFVGQPLYSVHFYNLEPNEIIYDEQDAELRGYLVSAGEKSAFPDLSGVDWVVLREDRSGFVHTRALSEQQWQELEEAFMQEFAPQA